MNVANEEEPKKWSLRNSIDLFIHSRKLNIQYEQNSKTLVISFLKPLNEKNSDQPVSSFAIKDFKYEEGITFLKSFNLVKKKFSRKISDSSTI